MLISDIYGMEIITNSGRRVGAVQEIIVDFEKGAISNLMLIKMDEAARVEDVRSEIIRHSIGYEDVRSIGKGTIIVSGAVKIGPQNQK